MVPFPNIYSVVDVLAVPVQPPKCEEKKIVHREKQKMPQQKNQKI